MAEQDKFSFEYLAFDVVSQECLGYSAVALDALLNANLAAPDSPILVIRVGCMGKTIWAQKMSLTEAREILEKRGDSEICSWMLLRHSYSKVAAMKTPNDSSALRWMVRRH